MPVPGLMLHQSQNNTVQYTVCSTSNFYCCEVCNRFYNDTVQEKLKTAMQYFNSWLYVITYSSSTPVLLAGIPQVCKSCYSVEWTSRSF